MMSASSTPHCEQISVSLSVLLNAPGYAPGASLLGMYPSHRGQMMVIVVLFTWLLLSL